MHKACSLHVRIFCLTLLAFIPLGFGCEHQASRERAQVQEQLQQAEQKLASSMQSQAGLEQTLSQLRKINGGTKQQQGSRDLMTATTQLGLAEIKSSQMGQLEARMRHELGYINTLMANASSLHGFINQRNINHTDLGTSTLEENRQYLDTQLEGLHRQIDDMQVPIEDMEELNTEQSRRVLDLRRAAEALRSEQNELGPLEGFDVFQRSIRADREANAIELEMTNRQIILDLESKPGLQQVVHTRDQVESHIDEIDSTNEGLRAMVSLQSTQAESARSLLQRTDAAINDAFTTFTDQDTGPLASEYLEVSSLLDSAATNASKGARNVLKDGRSAANLLETRARLALLLLQAHRIRGLQERLELLEHMASSTFLDSRDAYELQLKKAQETIESKRDEAINTGNTLIQSLSKVKRGEVDGIRVSVEQIMASLGAEPPPTPAPSTAPPPQPVEAPQATTDTTTAGSGYPTPQALVEHLNRVFTSNQSLIEKMREMMATTYATTPQAKESIKQQIDFTQAFNELQNAMQAKFGTNESPMVNMLKVQMELPTIDVSTLKQTSDTTAECSVQPPMAAAITQYLIKTPQGWKVDYDKTFEATPQLAQAMQMLPMFIQALKKVTNQVKSGKISNALGVDMAMGQAMGGAQGAGGPGRP